MRRSPTMNDLVAKDTTSSDKGKSRFSVVKPGEGYKDVVNAYSDSDDSDGFLTGSDDEEDRKGSRIRQRKLKEFQERREKEWRDKWEDPSKLEKFQKTIKRRVKLKKLKKKGMSRKIQKKFRENLKDEGRQMRLLYNYLLNYRRWKKNHKLWNEDKTEGKRSNMNKYHKLFKKYTEQMELYAYPSPHLNVKGYLKKYFENKKDRHELLGVIRNKLDMDETEFFQSLGIFSEMVGELDEGKEGKESEDELPDLPELSDDDGDLSDLDGGRKKKRKKRKTKRRTKRKRKTKKRKKKYRKKKHDKKTRKNR